MRIAALLPLLLVIAPPLSPAHAQSSPGTETDRGFASVDEAVQEAKTAMMADPGQAMAKAEIAIARARALPRSPRAEMALATAEWLKAESFIGVNQPAKAAPIVAAALARVERYGSNTKLQGDLMRSHGAIAAMGGSVQQALIDFQRAHTIFRAAREIRSQAIALQDIAMIYVEAGDYERALQYYAQAVELYTADPAFTLTTHNNRGEVLRKIGRNAEAVREFERALESARQLQSPLLEVRILSNLAVAQVKSGAVAAASRTIDRALRLSGGGEAAGWKPMVYGAAGEVAEARGDLPAAARDLRQAFAGEDLARTEMAFREFHQLAASVFERLGDEEAALQHLKAFQRLESEAQKLTASASSQLMSARFDYQNQKQKIFERDARIRQQQAEFRTTVLAGLVIAGGIVLALLLVSALRIRRSRNQVRAANVVLNQTNTALEKALKAKTEFLATTSHEIRTPLNGILGMTQILLANRRLEEEVREQVQVVHGAGEAMRALVDDILDVAKMETGEITVVDEEIGFRAILEDAARLWNGHAEAKGLRLTLTIGEVPDRIRSDGARLRQIVFNLLSNAVKFTPQGAVALRARAEGGELVIEVEDSGIGIPEDQLPLIFEAFHQVDGGTARQFSGTGLGLSICHKLAVALSGAISVRSVPGQGSVFTVRLPFGRVDGAIAAVVAGRPGATALAESRLLLVEGNAMTQGIFRGLLEPVTGAIECVDCGGAALSALRIGIVDHVLIEARSAQIEGSAPLDSLRRVIEAARTAGTRVTILLAPAADLPLGEVAQLGADQLVLKPVGGAQLVATLHEAYRIVAAPPAAISSAA
ncbi:signal transduction histidine kinase [Sphingomonas naasensis]|uniref:histidine kinase n=1 Tax=Sphingomonas naasensis TaxID=1344951 RepID=A0A4S1WU25_9SPHN|nr:ATP-binding protein [Sphingomonas naasensis]NIJ19047.1 signal transduction histidine kinase [Sphingomonas naasensis]TGX46245.1 tetratricopeptide repeat protein [Sphingomonas naasensis]